MQHSYKQIFGQERPLYTLDSCVSTNVTKLDLREVAQMIRYGLLSQVSPKHLHSNGYGFLDPKYCRLDRRASLKTNVTKQENMHR